MMHRGSWLRVGAAATLSLALLTGCSGMPPEVSGALDTVASVVGGAFQTLSSAVGDALGGTSVAEAREQRRSELVPQVDDADLLSPGTLTVGIKTGETAPLAIMGSDGSLSGIDVDTAYALADALGLARVELVSVQNASSALGTECDVVMGVKSGESADVMALGDYAQSALGVFSAQEVPTVPVSASDLTGKTVGVQGSSVSQVALRDLGITVSEQTFSNLNEAFDALSSGTVDYVVCDAYAGAYLACIAGDVSFAGTLDVPVSVGVGVSAASSGLQSSVQQAIDEIQVNGVADIARSRWIGEFPALTEESRIVVVAP